MGLPFRIVLYAPNPAKAAKAAEAAFARISQLNSILSDYETDSELSRLSRTSGSGQAVPVSEDLWRVLERANQFAQRTGGAFDVTVGPYVSLWRRARRERKLPNPLRLAEAGKAVGYRRLELDPKARTARLTAPNMRLDLGGIAKGYALEEALQVLQAQGIRSALISGGGDLAVSGPPPGKPGWRIEVAPLDVPNAPPARYVLLARAALATSGDLFQRLEIDGRRYSHIVDPRTGIGLQDHSLVTVIARDGMTADALATAASVLGPARGVRLVESEPGAAAFVVRQPGSRWEQRQTRRFKQFLEPASP
jgi:thiamine biosynthesis lipoprotein